MEKQEKKCPGCCHKDGEEGNRQCRNSHSEENKSESCKASNSIRDGRESRKEK